MIAEAIAIAEIGTVYFIVGITLIILAFVSVIPYPSVEYCKKQIKVGGILITIGIVLLVMANVMFG